MKPAQPDTILLEECRWRLLKLWFFAGLAIFLPVVGMCFLRDNFREHWSEIIGWVLPNISPTLALIASVVAANAIDPRPSKTRVSRRFYSLTFWCSAFYLALVLLPFFVETRIKLDILTVIRISNLWMGVIQTLVVAQISVLFFPPSPAEQNEDTDLAEAG